MKKTILFFTILTIFFYGCSTNGIKKGDDLLDIELDFIKKKGLLENSEKIIFFDSQLDYKTSGNFFSNQKIATYWIYAEENSIEKEKYENIEGISIEYSDTWDISTKIIITRIDGSQFEIYIDDDLAKEKKFFERLLKEWNKKK